MNPTVDDAILRFRNKKHFARIVILTIKIAQLPNTAWARYDLSRRASKALKRDIVAAASDTSINFGTLLHTIEKYHVWDVYSKERLMFIDLMVNYELSDDQIYGCK